MSVKREIKMVGDDLNNVTITKDITKLGRGKTVITIKLGDGRDYAFDRNWAVKMAGVLETQRWAEREPRRKEIIARLKHAAGE
ncbi:hypothetical protein [Verrucomicrobium spinosum]|uniref:hypothetical protein n=1 Tax=Verrucomicrobium spinosum TaxID=2736 RepID=UPI00017452F1|nr:hypothetical protein [Verrucomicrobium spinosum]